MVAHEEESIEIRVRTARQFIWTFQGVQAVGLADDTNAPVIKVYFESREALDAASLASCIHGIGVEAVVSKAFRAS